VPPEAESVAEYDAPDVAEGRAFVLTTSWDGSTVDDPTAMDRSAVALWGVGVVESVTCTVKLELPVVLGVPVMAPLDERLRPEGSEPAVIAHV
jgi:hypothetical protein